MSSVKQLKLAQKNAAEQQQVILELEGIVNTIHRTEKTITDLKTELDGVNLKHQGRKTTQEDIAYLNDLLRCANRKLAWEKQLASLQKRTPAVLERLSVLMNDPKAPPADEMRAGMLRALQGVQAAMERLQNLKLD